MGTGLQLFAQHSSGEMFPVEISLSPCTVDDTLLTIATIRDVSERQESASQMAMLRDRERIARDLHDMVIQRLFAAGMRSSGTPHALCCWSAHRICTTEPSIMRRRLFELPGSSMRGSWNAPSSPEH